MTDIAHQQRDALPSRKQLLKLTGVALVIAGVLLIAVVLPAEYGIDPTGIGRRLGLASLSAAPPSAPAREATGQALTLSLAPSAALVWKAPAAYRSDELSLTLAPNEGAEIKASMREGERFVFTWVAEGGVVNFDMHGEKTNAGSDDFTSYWKGRGASEGHGEFQAPFAGNHGWYWRNRGTAPVTIKVRTSGFYEKLYKPAVVAAPPAAFGESK